MKNKIGISIAVILAAILGVIVYQSSDSYKLSQMQQQRSYNIQQRQTDRETRYLMEVYDALSR